MNTPQGYNPVGQSAPGLPRHDAPLQGHVPGQYTPTGGGDENWSPSVGYRDPNFPPWFGEWSGRVILFVAMYLTVPVQVALYPIAGLAAALVGGTTYLLLMTTGMERDSALNWVWTNTFFGLVAMMRTETGFEMRNPGYRSIRHWLRLGLIFVLTVYFDVHDQGDSVGTAVLMAAIITALSHFFLRGGLTRGIWEGLQAMGWLRKEQT